MNKVASAGTGIIDLEASLRPVRPILCCQVKFALTEREASISVYANVLLPFSIILNEPLFKG